MLPPYLCLLAGVQDEIHLAIEHPVTQSSLLDAIEARYPMLRGTLRDQTTRRRRPYLRYFACETDLSHEAPDTPLPAPVLAGLEPFIILGALSGG